MPAKKKASKSRAGSKGPARKKTARKSAAKTRRKAAGKTVSRKKTKASKKKASSKKKAPAKRKKTSKKTKTAAKKTAKKKAARKRVSKKSPPSRKKASKKKATRKKTAKKSAAKKKTATKKKAVKKGRREEVQREEGHCEEGQQEKSGSRQKSGEKNRPPLPGRPALARKKRQNAHPERKAIPTTRRRDSAIAPIRPPISTAKRSRKDALSGPIHGIAPYKPKRGEEYMSDAQLEHFREILLAWKRELMEEVDRTVHHMQDEAANFPDPNDRATQESEFGLELRTRDRERKLLRKIDQALGRIDDGTYGYCDATGEEIGLKRLEARPVATMSLEAQERRELAERQFRDRDDRYR